MSFAFKNKPNREPIARLVDPLWERQRGESRQAFQAFTIYRDMGVNRSVAKTSKAIGKAQTMLTRWCSKWRWVERAEAWDAEQDRVKRESRLKAIEDMEERHIKLAMAAQQKAIERLATMESDELNVRDVLSYLQATIGWERDARRQPTERVDVKMQGKVSIDDLATKLVAQLPTDYRDALACEFLDDTDQTFEQDEQPREPESTDDADENTSESEVTT